MRRLARPRLLARAGDSCPARGSDGAVGEAGRDAGAPAARAAARGRRRGRRGRLASWNGGPGSGVARCGGHGSNVGVWARVRALATLMPVDSGIRSTRPSHGGAPWRRTRGSFGEWCSATTGASPHATWRRAADVPCRAERIGQEQLPRRAPGSCPTRFGTRSTTSCATGAKSTSPGGGRAAIRRTSECVWSSISVPPHSQVIVATQSPHFVDHFEPEDVLVTERERGGTRVTRLDGDRLDPWLADYSLGQLWGEERAGR